MNPHYCHTVSRHARAAALCEPLEGRLLCKLAANGEFVIDPPGGGHGHSAIHVQPIEGLNGLRTAREQSNGVVNWQVTRIHEWTPGDHGGPSSFRS
jgi:hypothetical protein